MSINIIVAMTKNRVIGKDNHLLWNIKEDMKLFKQKTFEQTVIMGKNTWFSIPEKFRPLPHRNNIVVSRSLNTLKGATVCSSVEEAVKKGNEFNKEIFCIGGSMLYESILPLTNILHISWVKENYEGNKYFPEIDFSQWEKIEEKEFEEFIYKKYKRK